MVTRREFLTAAAGYAVSSFRPHARPEPVEGRAESSRFDKLTTSGFSAPQPHTRIKFGYAAITWGDAIEQAMDDIAAVGFRGIQLRLEAFTQFGDKPAALREQLERRRLTFVALSSGNLSIDPARERAELATHVAHAKFLRDAGGLYLQVIDERPKGRAITADDYKRLGRLLTELGKRTGDLGIPLVYHHHMNSLGEKPREVAAVVDAADRRHVRVLFDVAHYLQGGGNPVADLRRYREWVQLLHIKDVRSGGSEGSGGSGGSGGYQFVELGRGRVDLPRVFAVLSEIGYDGWAVVELDRVPDPGGTPKQSAEINKRYLVERLHQTI